MNRDEVRLSDMLTAARDACAFVHTHGRTEIENDRMQLLALIKAVEIIGEAASKLSEQTKNEIPEIAWQQIIGMRHRLVHDYFDIDLDMLFGTINQKLPELIRLLEAHLNKK